MEFVCTWDTMSANWRDSLKLWRKAFQISPLHATTAKRNARLIIIANGGTEHDDSWWAYGDILHVHNLFSHVVISKACIAELIWKFARMCLGIPEYWRKLAVTNRVAISPVVLRWLYDSPRTGCAWRITSSYV